SSVGAVNSWYYSRQLSEGNLSVWPVARNCNNVLRFTFIRPQYIPEDQPEQVQIPVEWYLPLKLRVAPQIGLNRAKDPNKQVTPQLRAEAALHDATSSDNDYACFSFHPEECCWLARPPQ